MTIIVDRKIALIIGASGDIGFAIAERLHKDGFGLCLTYMDHKDRLMQKLETASISPLEILNLDAANGEGIKHAIASLLVKYRYIDVVVHCAVPKLENKRVEELEWEDDFKIHIDVSAKAIFCAAKALMSQIKEKHMTRFIAILTEYCSARPPGMLAHYVTGKYAMMGLVKAMAAELGHHGCTFNMVSPGMVRSSLITNLPEKLIEMTANSNPMRRIARPEDVANAVAFLASNKADYINGENIFVNGGNVM